MYYNVCAHTHTKIPLLKNKIINKSNAIFDLKKNQIIYQFIFNNKIRISNQANLFKEKKHYL